MTDTVKAPEVSLGAGSYDYDALKAATDAAVQDSGGDTDKADLALKTAVEASNEHPAVRTDPRDIAGYVWEKVEGSTGQVETIQVPVAAEAESEKKDGTPARKSVPTSKPTSTDSDGSKPSGSGAADTKTTGEGE